AEHLVQILAGGGEGGPRRQSAAVLLHHRGVALALNAQDGVGGIGTVAATGALEVATAEADGTDGSHQLALFGPAVVFLASAGAAADGSPFFSEASMRRATASARRW